MNKKPLTKKEREGIVLNTWNQELHKGEGKRFFIFDCNYGVLDPEFNERLRNFLQDAIKNYNVPDTKLFKVILKSNYNRSLPERIEFIRCKDEKILKDSMISACSASTSEYYGYVKVEINEITIQSFPEMITAIIEVKNGK